MTYNNVEFEVNIKAGIEQDTGKVYAHFYSYQPGTELPPTVDIGFLPPEDDTGRGMGFINYTINHQKCLADNTEIRNIAKIVFDMGEVIYTNQIDPHDPSQGNHGTPQHSANFASRKPRDNHPEMEWRR